MIRSLTSLRGIFIIFIFFHHCLSLYPGGGTLAVTFFFVLSGFSLTLGYKERVFQPDFNYRQFIIRRCIKFYPLHWICLLASIPIVGFTLKLKQGAFFFLNASLLQTLIPYKSIYFSYNAPSWYLANTMLFTIVFPPLVKFVICSSRKGRMGLISTCITLYSIVLLLIPREWYHYVLYISPYIRIMDFLLGIFLALCYSSLKKGKPRFFISEKGSTVSVISIVIIALLVFESYLLSKPINCLSPLYWPLIALLLMIVSLNDEHNSILKNRFLQRLGELSFIIFLIHGPILTYSSRLFNRLNIEQNALYIIITLTLTILGSMIVERYMLKPISRCYQAYSTVQSLNSPK